MKPPTARLLISCPDRKGIIAAATGFLADCQANVLEADQHSDPDDGTFCMRLEYETADMVVTHDEMLARFARLAADYRMEWRVAYSADRKRAAILVSKEDHCLHDLLLRRRCGEIDVDIPLIVSNHSDLEPAAAAYGVEFHTLPVAKATKLEQERSLLQLLEAKGIDFVILARYMQVLTRQVIDRYPSRIINIHHSFLPAFAGRRPYHQAYERGVKVVGATAHYVTEELDAGPIIAQATTAINHRDTVDDLVRKGRDLERTVLATAVRLHVQDKVLVHQNRTIVFE